MRLRSRCWTAIAVWPALIGIASSAARGQEPPVAPSGALPAAPAPPPPPLVRRPRVGLMIGGVAIFAAAWVPAVIISGQGGGCDDQKCRDAHDVFWIPVLGPILASTVSSNFGKDLAVLWTLAEAGGIAMFVVGLIGRKVPVDPPAQSSWRITPTVSRGTAGLTFGATF